MNYILQILLNEAKMIIHACSDKATCKQKTQRKAEKHVR